MRILEYLLYHLKCPEFDEILPMIFDLHQLKSQMLLRISSITGYHSNIDLSNEIQKNFANGCLSLEGSRVQKSSPWERRPMQCQRKSLNCDTNPFLKQRSI